MIPEEVKPYPEDILMKKIVSTVVKWAEDSEIENIELIRQMFHLLLRCYNAVGKLMDALGKAYVISNKSKSDVEQILQNLNKVRALLPGMKYFYNNFHSNIFKGILK